MPASEPFAVHLLGRREAILQAWTDLVAKSPEVSTSKKVSNLQLRDHLPQLLEDLARHLDAGSGPRENTESDAEAHGNFRWQQGYNLSEVLDELSLLRRVLIGELARHAAAQPDFRNEARLSASEVVHRFIDKVARISTLEFTEQQQADVEKLSLSRLNLLQTVSHEVRNAVNAIHLVLSLQNDSDGPTRREESGATLRRTVSHLRDLLDDLLDFARLSEGHVALEMAPVDLRHFASDLEIIYRPACEKAGLQWSLEVDSALGTVESDATKLRQIAGNLLDNALKYTGEGQIALALGQIGTSHWSLRVTDSGRGLSADAQKRVFEEFYRAPGTANIRGTGLGLSITRRLAELLGGSIRLESEQGRGSTFEVELPKCADA